MKIKELDSIINEALEKEARKIIMEQADQYDPLADPNYDASGVKSNESENHSTDNLIEKVKNFQSLSGLLNKITTAAGDGDNIMINVNNITPEELVDACGGSSLSEALKNLMQGIHHDLEENQFGSDLDVDIDTQGDENALNLIIKISANKDKTLTDTDMNENKKDTNPTVDDKKDVILGGKTVCSECGKPCNEDICDECAGKQKDVKEDKKWIQKAVNPKHKGYCTPMTKKTCTPKRKALAKRFKKGIDESTGKKILTLTESEMAALLKKIIKEASTPTMDATTAKAIKDSGSQNNEALKAVEKKIKDYLNFKGNDKPENFHQVGQGDEKVARQNSTEEDEIVDLERGRGPQDLNYDQEPSEMFKERQKMSLVGDSKMGNPSDAANAIKTDVGEKVYKSIEKSQKARANEPLYKKEGVPVKEKAESEPERGLKNPVVEKDIERMKQLGSYNKKTQ